MYNNNNFQKTTGRSRDVPLVLYILDYLINNNFCEVWLLENHIDIQNFKQDSNQTKFWHSCTYTQMIYIIQAIITETQYYHTRLFQSSIMLFHLTLPAHHCSSTDTIVFENRSFCERAKSFKPSKTWQLLRTMLLRQCDYEGIHSY